MLTRAAQWTVTHRRMVVAAWLSLLIGLIALNAAGGGPYQTKFDLPGSDSQAALTLLESRFPARSGGSADVVIASARGVDDPSVRADVERLLAQVATVGHVEAVVSPYQPANAGQVSQDRTVAYAEVRFDTTGALPMPTVHGIEAMARSARSPSVDVELAGDWFSGGRVPSTEGIGILAAVIILLLAFGSVLAMGLPIVTALFGIGTGVAAIGLLANVLPMPGFTGQLAVMLGLGVGIDYALFIVTRYRQELASRPSPEAAVVAAVATSGKAVLFAGCTVVISLLGMVIMGLGFLNGLAVASSLAVAVAMLASLTLLPAVLGFVGHTIDRLRVPGAGRGGPSGERGFWRRWSRTVQRRPWAAAAAGLVVLVALAAPLASLRLGASDAGNGPTTDTTRRAYDTLGRGFGAGFNGPLLVAVEVPSAASRAALPSVERRLAASPGVATVTPAQINQAGDAAVLQLFPTTSPQDQRTVRLIHHLRQDVLPSATAGSGLLAHVGGQTAAVSDLSARVGARLPLFIGAVLALSFLLLMAVFRSILVPLKAVLVDLLSIGAAYGVLVAVFQWGWGGGLLNLQPGPVEAFVPMMLFAILFGLSMDYEMFLLSRVKEEYDRSRDNGEAVVEGLSATARVITAAAAIMIMVFGGFIFGADRVIKEFGIGLAGAILIDATLVRLVLVPATMELLGDANWWFPHLAERSLPHIHIEVNEPAGVGAAR
jgi:RND superfamily putative drug exporter